MKVLIIGGNRYFGKRLASLWVDNGAEVTLLNRGQIDDGFKGQVERIRMDRRNLDATSFKGRFWDVIYDQVCYDATEAELACEVFRDKTARYVFTSTQSIYPVGVTDQAEEAFDPYHYIFKKRVSQSESYAEAKRQAEATFFQRASFPVTALRIPFVLGEDDYTLRLKFHVDRIRDGKPIYFPKIDAKVSFVYAQDVAQFLLFLSKHEFGGPINCCSEEPMILRDLVKRIELVTHKKAKLAQKASDGEHSPYGVDEDRVLRVTKMKGLGFLTQPISSVIEKLLSSSSEH